MRRSRRSCSGRSQSGIGTEVERRVPDRGTARHSDRRGQRQRTVRKGADDLIPPASLSKLMTAEVVFNRDPAGTAQADRRIHRQRQCVAARRRALAHVEHVHPDPQQGVGGQSAAWRHHSVRERRMHRARRGDFRKRVAIRRADDQARARARPDQVHIRQFERTSRSQAAHDLAGARQARATHHPDLSRLLSSITASASLPGTRSANSIEIRCSP